VGGQLRVGPGDAGQAVADALGDGLAGPLGRVAEAAVAPAKPEGRRQLVGDGVALGARLLEPGGVALLLGAGDLPVELAEAPRDQRGSGS
jgi:hypothetical protein